MPIRCQKLRRRPNGHREGKGILLSSILHDRTNQNTMNRFSPLLLLACLLAGVTLSAQCLEGDCANGEGSYRYSSGARYTGPFINGKSQGIGICYWPDGSFYHGEWAEGLPHGKGAKTLNDGKLQVGWFEKGRFVGEHPSESLRARGGTQPANDKLEGCISGNCYTGRGVYVFPSGAVYTGDFLDGEIHGNGLCHFSDGSEYRGQWQHRQPHGQGTMAYSDGSQRTGMWERGQPVDGQGALASSYLSSQNTEAANTDVQAGCISGDCFGGRGTLAYIDGSRYEGVFRNGLPEGRGTFYYPNGEKYSGEFRNGVPNGKGTLYQINGNVTDGFWQDGEYSGRQARPEKGCISGDCQEGFGTYIFKEGDKYVGSFHNGLPHGRGTVFYDNGERYEGEMAAGKLNGYGTLFLKDGSEVSGNWQSGVYAPHEQATSVPLSPEPAPGQPGLQIWAVVIGIAAYNHMPVLRYTDDDAYRMYAFLKSPEGGALDDSHIRILIDEEATLSNIKKTMAEIFNQAGRNDLVLLYYSGHGLPGAFLPYDFDGYSNKLFHEEINALLKRSPAKYKLCIADACHSGSLLAMRGSNPNMLANYYNRLAQANPGTALIMSSKSEETSLESSGLRQGVFSHYLIRGLKGEADKDADGYVTVQELYNFVYTNVRAYTGNMQSPLIQGDYDRSMPVAIRRD